ncbi:aminophospholipid ATPase 1 [Hibiscus trionum]|uniref:Aminophospholipid ATPase 1 n=1 Tax=Hibiscus trionum TaxID=183268 RepID=A0A9W7J8G8_HIBTR|nr:aminophospholipid ATPase 1 [Hibiscus trionum]
MPTMHFSIKIHLKLIFLVHIFSDPCQLMPSNRAIFEIAQTGLFWLCLLAIIITALIPRFVVKVLYQFYTPCDVQIAQETEKFQARSESGAVEVEMNLILDHPRQ